MISSSAGDQDGALADIAISNRAAEHMHAAPNTDDMPLHRFPIATLLELCRYHAMNRPSSAAYAWLNAQEVETLCLTYAELDRRARCIGAQNAQRGLQAGIQPQTKTLRNLDTRARRHAPDCTSSPGNVKQGAAVRALCIRRGAR